MPVFHHKENTKEPPRPLDGQMQRRKVGNDTGTPPKTVVYSADPRYDPFEIWYPVQDNLAECLHLMSVRQTPILGAADRKARWTE